MINGLVSIIMPAYNSEKYIKESIESVLAQSYEKWELLIVDDCSTDNTLNICKSYEKIDHRIKVICNQTNQGVSNSRQIAINLSQGQYIAFLDSDDLWYRNKLKCQISFMKKNNYGFTFTSYDVFKDDNLKITNTFYAKKVLNYNDYLKDTIIGCFTVIMDKKIIGSVYSEGGNLEDVKTWLKYLRMGYTAYGLEKVLGKYRVHTKSRSNNKLSNAIKYFELLIRHEKIFFITAMYYELCYIFNAIKKRYLK